jgi:hypothetical protein
MNKDVLLDKFKKNVVRFGIGATIFVVALVLKIVVGLFTDILVVYAGIRLFGVLSALTTILLIVGIAAGAGTLAILLKSRAELRKLEAVESADSNAGPVLKVKGKLDPVQIRNSLITEGDKWLSVVSPTNPKEAEEMDVAIKSVKETMAQMDDYQLRLKNLLDSNGADALRDTEEVLDGVEQHICRNVRKLLNIMTVSSPNTQNDLDVVELTAKNCAEDNNRLLQTTKEFIVAVTEFLNSQGDSGSSINEVEVYKNALTTQIEEGGIYS